MRIKFWSSRGFSIQKKELTVLIAGSEVLLREVGVISAITRRFAKGNDATVAQTRMKLPSKETRVGARYEAAAAAAAQAVSWLAISSAIAVPVYQEGRKSGFTPPQQRWGDSSSSEETAQDLFSSYFREVVIRDKFSGVCFWISAYRTVEFKAQLTKAVINSQARPCGLLWILIRVNMFKAEFQTWPGHAQSEAPRLRVIRSHSSF